MEEGEEAGRKEGRKVERKPKKGKKVVGERRSCRDEVEPQSSLNLPKLRWRRWREGEKEKEEGRKPQSP